MSTETTPGETLTPGEVAKMLHVSNGTVNKWFDRGQLAGFRVPNSRHRRILRDSLIEFVKHHGLPFPQELKTKQQVTQEDKAVSLWR